MALDPITLSLIGVNLLSARGSQRAGRGAAKANARANELEAERRGIQNSLARRKALAERRRLQASVRAEALAAGVGISSGANAAEASIDAQTSTEVGTQRQLQEIDLARDAELKKAQAEQTRSSNIQAGGQVATSLISNFTG